MKKSILIPFLFMGLLAFASCKGTSENKSTTATDTVCLLYTSDAADE